MAGMVRQAHHAMVERDGLTGNLLDRVAALERRLRYMEDTHSGQPGEAAGKLAYYREEDGSLHTPGFVVAGDVIRARVRNSANLTIGTGAWTSLTFDSERWDTDGIHSTVSNTGRLTCVTEGTYSIIGNVRFASNATGYRAVRIYLNGATVIAEVFLPAVSGQPTVMAVGTQYELDAGDYVELQVLQNSGGDLNVEVAAAYSPEFMMGRR